MSEGDISDPIIGDQEATQGIQPDSSELAPGTVLHEKYKIIGLLGRGGMGSVYRVEHLLLQKDFALKVLNQQHSNDAAWRRFEIEARAANKLDHPNLVKVHDSDLLPDGQPYFIMDLIEGESLADLLKSRGRLPLDKALKIFIQVGFALSYAHSNGVIHRDIKPSNIMISAVGDGFENSRPAEAGDEKNIDSSVDAKNNNRGVLVKVVDFGIAKLTGQDTFNQQTLTRTGEIFGSPLYMSPEQCLGIAIDQRCDLYSLGCVIFEALTGAPPLVGENALATMMKHQSETPPSLKEASMGIEFPQKMEEIVARLLEKEPQRRYQSAQHLTADLVGLDSGQLSMFEAPVPLPPPTTIGTKLSTGVSIFYALCILTAGILTGLALPRISASAPAVNPFFGEAQVLMSIESDLKAEKNKDRKVIDKRLDALEKDLSPFSYQAINSKDRIYHFPPFSIGLILADNKAKYEAKGDILFRKYSGFIFRPTDQFQMRPTLFKKFRPDDIRMLDLGQSNNFMNLNENDMSAANMALTGIEHMKGLQGIDLGDTNIEIKNLMLIDKLPELQQLYLTRINLPGSEISKLKCLNKVWLLKIVRMKDIDDVIKQIKTSRVLKNLIFTECDFNKSQLQQLSGMRSLEKLEIAGNPKIDDDALKYLPPNLKMLDVHSCSVTPKCMDRLFKMKQLKEVFVTGTNWSTMEMSKLRAHFPKVLIFDSEGQTI